MRGAALLVAVLALATPAANDDTLRQVLDRARAYLDRYHDELATVIAEERYAQAVARPGRSAASPRGRLLESEYLLLRTVEVPSGWLGFRDVLVVDGKPVADREGRLEGLLKSAGPGLGARARAIAEESARFNVGTILRTINVPTMALEFLTAANAARVEIKKTAETNVNGIPVWTVEFRETFAPTLIGSPDGGDVRASGAWWIEPATGRVMKTEIRTDTPASRTTVTYELDEKLKIWIPRQMTETYRDREGEITGTATYSNYRRFETSGRLVKPPGP